MAKKPNKTGVFSQKQIQANAARLLENTCEKLVGSGLYAKFPSYSKALILENRYNAVKLAGSVEKIYSNIFRSTLDNYLVSTLTGEQIALGNYLREGLMLIQYVEMMSRDTQDFHPELIEAFKPYFAQTEQYQLFVSEIIDLLSRLAIMASGWSGRILSYDINELCAINGITASNQVTITMHKPEPCSVQLEGNKRELLRAGWPELMGNMDWISLPPAKFGFFAGGNHPRPLFVQRHALKRLDERLGIHKGLIHHAVADSLQAENCRWQRFNEKTLIPLLILEKKVGYLVMSCDQEKLIIRTFLFLTNNGTPEGNRLSELTALAPLDKKYLQMDTLLGFASYDFPSNPELSSLFSQAGCEDLLEIEALLKFSEGTIQSKNSLELMRYLGQYKTS